MRTPILPSGSPDQLHRFKSAEALALVRPYYRVKHQILDGGSPALIKGARIVAGHMLVMFDTSALRAYKDGLSNPVVGVAFRRQANPKRVKKLLRAALSAEILARAGPGGIVCKFCGRCSGEDMLSWKCKGQDKSELQWCCPQCLKAGKLQGEEVARWPPPDPALN